MTQALIACLMLLAFTHDICRADVHICDGSTTDCSNTRVQCREDEDCQVVCDGTSSCEQAVIECPAEHRCEVHCINPSAQSQCQDITIHATDSSYLLVNASLGATPDDNSKTLYNGHIYCPFVAPYTPGAVKPCHINCDGRDLMRYTTIYAVQGFNDVDIEGTTYSDTSWCFRAGDMRCKMDFSSFCDMSTDKSPPFSCTSQSDLTCDDYIVTIPPSLTPTAAPTKLPTSTPTPAPTESPTFLPTASPTRVPSPQPTLLPTETPTLAPTTTPTSAPTTTPTLSPTQTPTQTPTSPPTGVPSVNPSVSPSTAVPSLVPTLAPTVFPTVSPTSRMPTSSPSISPTVSPSSSPTLLPTELPSLDPTTGAPTASPTVSPTLKPTAMPTAFPSLLPTASPSVLPTPTPLPVASPTTFIPTPFAPTKSPSHPPTLSPSSSVPPTETPSSTSTSTTNIPTTTPSVTATTSTTTTSTTNILTTSTTTTAPPTATTPLTTTNEPTIDMTGLSSTTVSPSTAPSQAVEYREIDRTPPGAIYAASIIAALFFLFVVALCYFFYRYHKDEEDKISAELRKLHSAPENTSLVTNNHHYHHDGSDGDDAVHVFDLNESAKQDNRAQILAGSTGDAHLAIPSALTPLGEAGQPQPSSSVRGVRVVRPITRTSAASVSEPPPSDKRRRDWNRLQTQDELDVKRMLNERDEEERKKTEQRMQMQKDSDADQMFGNALSRFAQKNEDTLNKEVLLKIDRNEDPNLSESLAFSHNIDDNDNDLQSPFTPFTPQNRAPIGALESESDGDRDEKQSMSPLESIKKSVMDLFHSAVADSSNKPDKPKFVAISSESQNNSNNSQHMYHDSMDYYENEPDDALATSDAAPSTVHIDVPFVADESERREAAPPPKVDIRQKRKAIKKGGTGVTVGTVQQKNIEVSRQKSMEKMKHRKVVSDKKEKFEQMIQKQQQQKTQNIGDYDDRAMLIRPDQLPPPDKQYG